MDVKRSRQLMELLRDKIANEKLPLVKASTESGIILSTLERLVSPSYHGTLQYRTAHLIKEWLGSEAAHVEIPETRYSKGEITRTQMIGKNVKLYLPVELFEFLHSQENQSQYIRNLLEEDYARS